MYTLIQTCCDGEVFRHSDDWLWN